MKKFAILLVAFSTLFVFSAKAQYGFGTASPNQSAIVDMSSTSKGVLIPRVALTGTSDATTITNGNVTSLIVYNTATVSDVTPGFYYWNGTKWIRIIESNDGIPFNLITSGTNTSAAMVVGNGASLAPTGTGTVTANIFDAGGSTDAVDLNSAEVAGNLPIANIAPGSNNYVLTTNATGSTAWGLITNDNVSTTAAIEVSKLAPSTTDGYVLRTVGGTATWSTVADAMADLTDGDGIADFTYDGSSAATVEIDYTYAGTWTGTQTFDVASGNAAVFADAIDVQGNIANSGGDVTIDDNLAVTGNATITGNTRVDGTFQFDASGQAVNEIVTSVSSSSTDSQLPTAKAVQDAIDNSKTLTSGHIYVGNASNVATDVAMSGDVTITNAGVTTISADAVTTGKIANGTIIDEDISGTAAIAVSKLAAGTDGYVLRTVSGTPTWSTVSDAMADLTDGAGIADFTYDGSSSATVAVDYDDATINVDGSDKLQVKDDGITAAKINSDVAGDGLVQNGTSGALDVNVDDATIEIASDVVRVKDAGISTAKIADDAVTAAKINSDVAGTGLVQETNGALAVQTASIKTISGAYTASLSDGTILVDASSGNVAISLPAASATNKGLKLTIKKIDSSTNTVSVGTVDGTTKTWNVQWQGYVVQSDGSAWYVVGIL